MPYIKKDWKRNLIDVTMSGLPHLANSGELNYCVTLLMLRFVTENTPDFPTNYATANSAIGAVECAKLEFYRRLLTPHEEVKRAENGDVYEEVLEDEIEKT